MNSYSLKKKINFRFILIGCLTTIGMMILLTVVYYESFQKEVVDDLKSYTLELKKIGVFDEPQRIIRKKGRESIRITVVEKDGTVIFDNCVDVRDMDNHEKRPEVEQALEKGEGQAIRTSSTLNMSTFYYAVRLDNGTVLRTAKEADSVWSVFARSIPYVAVIAIVMLAAMFISSHRLTKSIILPIESMAKDMEHTGQFQTYEEIQPFIDTIQQQHFDLLKSSKMRQEFTANVSHELKTPLTAISGYSELIENGMANQEDIIRFASEIHRSSNRLLTMINDIIRLSELDVVENAVDIENIHMGELAQQIVDMLQINAEKYEVTVRFQGGDGIIYANRTMMEELVYNLTDNAIRYNKKGGIVNVSVRKEENRCTLVVEDNGIGISKENQERIFERFYRVDKSHSRQIGGTGLGLAIVKHIVAQHDAEIELDSRLGVGTKIQVHFFSNDVE